MANKYENIVEEFNKRNCKLLTTKEEHIEILKLAKKSMFKLNYTASCGHNHIVFYNVFKSRGTGVICPSCRNAGNGIIKKNKMNNNEISKTYTIEQEHTFIIKFCELTCNYFEIKKAFDGWALYTANVQIGNGGGRENKTFVNARQLGLTHTNQSGQVISNNNISQDTGVITSTKNMTFPRGFGGEGECDIGEFYYYNAQLTTTQIIQNFDATKHRYNV